MYNVLGVPQNSNQPQPALEGCKGVRPIGRDTDWLNVGSSEGTLPAPKSLLRRLSKVDTFSSYGLSENIEAHGNQRKPFDELKSGDVVAM
jgi:hypothetical protein